MLPSLGALSSVPTGAKDDVVTEIRAENREMAIRKVLNNDDLVKEILLALDQGIDSREVCELAERLCNLNGSLHAACKDHIWDDVGAHLWGKEAQQLWKGIEPRRRFNAMCTAEYELRKGIRKLIDDKEFKDIKRFVLAAIAGEDSYRTLSKASPRLRDDEEVVRAAIAKDARAIRFASPRLQEQIKTPLHASEYWPRDDATEFERLWGDEVLYIMLREDWEHPHLMEIIRTQLENLHPDEFETDYWTEHNSALSQLVQKWLRPHMIANIPALAA